MNATIMPPAGELARWQADSAIKRSLNVSRIAVVGLSPNPSRPSHDVTRYLLAQGYDIVGVNPAVDEVLGLPCYPTLTAVPGPIELVDVFRTSAAVPEAAAGAVAVGAAFLWLQLGVYHRDAIVHAEAHGITCIVDRCVKIEHARLRP